ncbi:MAG TPA: hypothetical protein VGN23_02925 [Verrucomicrobiae bacterium]|jgi:hypothetical protein
MNQDWLLLVSILFVVMVGGSVFIIFFQRIIRQQADKEREDRQRMANLQEVQNEMSKRQMAQMEQMIHSTLKSQEELQKKVVLNKPAEKDESFGLGSGGYIVFDMPDSQKPLFHDLLKGFEEYAKLRGYQINFSIDNSFADKVAFKFTLGNVGIDVSTKQVKQDLQDFINSVQKGDSLDNLPVVLSLEEHTLLLTCMKNRISFLQHNYNLQKNATEFYMQLLKGVPNLGLGFSHPQNFYMLSGDGSQATSYQALNSPQSIQGSGNRLIGNRLEQRIHIANSFNERSEQIRALSDLWAALYAEKQKLSKESPDLNSYSTAMSHISKVQTELEEEDAPDPNRINKWLQTAKNSLQTIGLTEELVEAVKTVWEAFTLSF